MLPSGLSLDCSSRTVTSTSDAFPAFVVEKLCCKHPLQLCDVSVPENPVPHIAGRSEAEKQALEIAELQGNIGQL